MPSSAKKNRGVLWMAFAIVLVDMLGVGILIPIIPLLFTDPAYPYHLDISAHSGFLLLGVLTALYPIMQFIFAPILGQLSDRFGRRPLLYFSLFGSAFAYALFAIGIIFRNLPLLFVSRALDGISGGSISVAQACIADTTDTDEERIRRFGFVSAANGIGFILGPLIGAFLSEPHLHHSLRAPAPFWFASGLALLNLAVVVLFMPETLKRRTKHSLHLWKSITDIKRAFAERGRRYLFMTSFLFETGFSFVFAFFGVYLLYRFNFEQHDIGYMFAFVGFMLALSQIFVTGPLAKRVAPSTIIPIALFIMAASLISVYFIHSVAFMYILIVPGAISGGLVLANLTGLLSASAGKESQGGVLGLNSSVKALAQSLPPLFAGVIAAFFAPTAPVVFGAAGITSAGLVFLYYSRRHKNKLLLARAA